jgi:NAD(P)-dependent dehydrogenase (short-subunit alcohol dehydrogenase family)
MEQLEGKVAVLTGAGSGIGRATALALAAEGARVVVSDLHAARCDEVVTEIVEQGGTACAQPCDVTSDEDMAALRAAAFGAFGDVDIVMNNVGILSFGRPENIPLEAWWRDVDANLLSVARSIHVFLPDLLAKGSGHIVNTASTAGLYGYTFERLAYSATKGAVASMSEALAIYLQPKGIGVTLLCPGPVATNITEQITVYGEIGPTQAPDLAILDPAVVGAQVVDAIKTNRFLLPTHDEVFDILRERAADVDAFVASTAERLAQ